MVEITALEGGDVEITEIELPCEQNIWVNREITDIQDNFTAAEIAEEVKNMLEIIDASDTFLSLEDSLTMFAAKENSPKHILEYCLKGLKEV
jgi:Trk K+ transport system NAD-binding subunit